MSYAVVFIFSQWWPLNARLTVVCRVRVMVLNATFNYISYIVAVSFIGGGNRVPKEDHRPVASHWQTWSRNKLQNFTSIQTTCYYIIIYILINTCRTCSSWSSHWTNTGESIWQVSTTSWWSTCTLNEIWRVMLKIWII